MPAIPADPTAVTPAWLGEVLQADVRACKLEQIAIGVGLLGRLFRVHLDGGQGVPATVVVKLPGPNPTVRTELCEALELYLTEVRFYQQLGVANPLPPARPYFAAVDDATHDFVLVLEDLGRLRLADQVLGCSPDDAETVVDAIAAHHAHWWNNERLAALHWLKAYDRPRFSDGLARNFTVALPRFLDYFGSDLSRRMRDFCERFLSLMPWFLHEFSQPPRTFLHGDLRLDQLFFGVSATDPPVTVLDWQLNTKGRGAYDLSYFLSQSLRTDVRRCCEARLIERYVQRLAEHGIDYPREQLRRDYRLTTAWCFIYPIMAAGRLDFVNDRNVELVHTMLARATAAIEDHDGLTLRPD